MALILFGTSAANQVYRVGTTGGVANTTVTGDAAGSQEVFSNPVRSYLMRIPAQQLTVALAAASTIWCIHAGNALTMRIKRLTLVAGFAGTAAATASEFQLIRWSAASGTNMTTGTVIAATKKSSPMATSTIADARFNYAAALGVVGVTFDADPFYEIGVQRQVSATVAVDTSSASVEQYQSVIALAPNEGIAIRLGQAAVIGDMIGGMIEWTEV